MKKYETVIFDLDGTLLNTLDDLADAVNFVMRANGFPERTLEEVRHFVGNGIRKLMERAVPEGVGGEAFEAVFEQFKTYYTEHCQIKTKVYDGVPELLEKLSAEGIALAIVSNKNQAAVTELYHIYFKEHLNVAIGQRDGVRKKPAPDTVFESLKELGKTKEGALYVGDSDVDFHTAANSGLDCALVTWGFRTKEELRSFTPDCFADNAQELFDFIMKE